MKRIFLYTAILLGLAVALTRCGLAKSDAYAADIYVFNNHTASEVVLEAYDGGVLVDSWTIEAGGSLRQAVPSAANATDAKNSALYSAVSVFHCREARMVFGGVRELRFSADDISSPHNIYNGSNYSIGQFNSETVEWHYAIDDEVARAATIIKR